MKAKLDQPDIFNDVSLILPKVGTDAGLQANMFGGVSLASTEPTEATQEAADIIKRAVLYQERFKPWREEID